MEIILKSSCFRVAGAALAFAFGATSAFAAPAPHTLTPSAAIQIPNLFTTYLSFDEIGIFIWSR